MTELLGLRSGRVKAARRLARRRHRTETGLFLAEGTKALTEALQVPGGVVEVYATREAVEQLPDLDVPVHLGTVEAVGALSGAVSPQGVVAVCRRVDVPLDRLLDGPRPGPVVVAADVRDPGNAGTLIRTADAVAARGVVLTGSSVDPYNDKTVRATVGSLWHLPLTVTGDTVETCRHLQAQGWTVLAADGAGELGLFDSGTHRLLRGPVAWLFGNEAWGLPDALAALADHRVSIPIPGRAESLNLSTAAAVCLYATAQARGEV